MVHVYHELGVVGRRWIADALPNSKRNLRKIVKGEMFYFSEESFTVRLLHLKIDHKAQNDLRNSTDES